MAASAVVTRNKSIKLLEARVRGIPNHLFDTLTAIPPAANIRFREEGAYLARVGRIDELLMNVIDDDPLRPFGQPAPGHEPAAICPGVDVVSQLETHQHVLEKCGSGGTTFGPTKQGQVFQRVASDVLTWIRPHVLKRQSICADL